ncbi:MAG: FHA domain-containing protein [Planctomycetes bacterium]|nr:FHA domain-containing protein [Planctomycetota bacterium]
MVFRIRITDGPGTGSTFSIPAGETRSIGRGEDAEIKLLIPVISRKHCTVTNTGEHLLVKDLGSRVGTLVDGDKILEYKLSESDTFCIGPVTFAVELKAGSSRRLLYESGVPVDEQPTMADVKRPEVSPSSAANKVVRRTDLDSRKSDNSELIASDELLGIKSEEEDDPLAKFRRGFQEGAAESSEQSRPKSEPKSDIFTDPKIFDYADGTLFGKIAVEEGFIHPDELDEMLDRQDDLDAEGSEVPTIGEMLLGEKRLTEQEIELVLRIQDYRSLSEDEQKIGRLAVRNGFLSQEELDRLLSEHRERVQEDPKFKLGELLVEKQFLDEGELRSLLRNQSRINAKVTQVKGTASARKRRAAIEEKDSKKNFVAIGGIAAAALIVIVSGYFIFGGPSAEGENSNAVISSSSNPDSLSGVQPSGGRTTLTTIDRNASSRSQQPQGQTLRGNQTPAALEDNSWMNTGGTEVDGSREAGEIPPANASLAEDRGNSQTTREPPPPSPVAAPPAFAPAGSSIEVVPGQNPAPLARSPEGLGGPPEISRDPPESPAGSTNSGLFGGSQRPRGNVRPASSESGNSNTPQAAANDTADESGQESQPSATELPETVSQPAESTPESASAANEPSTAIVTGAPALVTANFLAEDGTTREYQRWQYEEGRIARHSLWLRNAPAEEFLTEYRYFDSGRLAEKVTTLLDETFRRETFTYLSDGRPRRKTLLDGYDIPLEIDLLYYRTAEGGKKSIEVFDGSLNLVQRRILDDDENVTSIEIIAKGSLRVEKTVAVDFRIVDISKVGSIPAPVLERLGMKSIPGRRFRIDLVNPERPEERVLVENDLPLSVLRSAGEEPEVVNGFAYTFDDHRLTKLEVADKDGKVLEVWTCEY